MQTGQVISGQSLIHLGTVGGIQGQPLPDDVKTRYDDEANANLTDVVIGYLTADSEMVAEIHGIGNPDPQEMFEPQMNWYGNKTGFRTGTTFGRIWYYPLTIGVFDVRNGKTAWYRDTFLADNWNETGDSGALWLDQGGSGHRPRVHGYMIARTPDGGGYYHGVYARWWHVKGAWNIHINHDR
ncbi:MAG: hypothetical protein HZB53_22015 [Chloroflexi bacterium]|nr:hypothetical protein [Chloroflexota bacterium]